MKIAIPIASGQLCMHFGHCEQFAFVTVDPENKTVTGTELLTPPPHEPGVLPKWLSDLETNVVIAGGIGNQAISLLNQAGITVVTGAPVEKPETLVKSYLDNTLVISNNLCSEGGHHQCDH